MTPRVSVVMPVYNLEDIVLETVESVRQQTFHDLELIIVDDGSTDRTVERIEAIQDPRIKLIRAEHSGLPAAGRCRALAASSGEYLAIADADDVLLPQRIERQVEFLDRHPSVALVHSGYHLLIDGQVRQRSIDNDEPVLQTAADALPRMITNNYICTPTVMLRRGLVDRVGQLFDTDPLLCGPEDFDLWLRLCESGAEFGYIPEPLVLYRIRETSVSRNLIRNWRGNLRAFEKAHERSPQLYAKHHRLVRRRLASIYRNLGRMKLIEGEAGGLHDAWLAVRLAPLSLRAWGWTLLGLGGTPLVRSVMALRGQAGGSHHGQAA